MERFARAILDAQKIREESFDSKEANKMELEILIVKDFGSCYTISEEEAADKAAENAGYDKRGAMPIYLLNKYCWNDIQTWAEKILNSKEQKTKLCEFYPAKWEMKRDGPLCHCSSGVSGSECTYEYGQNCQWANEKRKKEEPLI